MSKRLWPLWENMYGNMRGINDFLRLESTSYHKNKALPGQLLKYRQAITSNIKARGFYQALF